MKVTKNDLSYQRAELDMQAMIMTAKLAKYHLTTIIRQRCDAIDNDKGHYSLEAEWLVRSAKHLQIVCETLDTLLGSEERWDCEIVNRADRQDNE